MDLPLLSGAFAEAKALCELLLAAGGAASPEEALSLRLDVVRGMYRLAREVEAQTLRAEAAEAALRGYQEGHQAALRRFLP